MPWPEPASRAAGEMLALVALLGTALKLDGRLTAQNQGQRPARPDRGRLLRRRRRPAQGRARFCAPQCGALRGARRQAFFRGAGRVGLACHHHRAAYCGKTYQGIVALSPEGIAASAEAYFAQSEQLPTLVRLAAAPVYTPGSREPSMARGRACCSRSRPAPHRHEDDWERLAVLARSVEDLELVDTSLSAETLLGGCSIRKRCACCPPSRSAFAGDCNGERIAAVLALLPA